MSSPQENYTYEQLKNYLEIAQTALKNFEQRYPALRTEVWQPEKQVATDMQEALNALRNRIAEGNMYLDEDEKDGVHIGTYSLSTDTAKRKKIERRIEKTQWRFKEDLRDLIQMYEIELKGLYMKLSAISAKFTADRIQEFHRREKWVNTQKKYYAQYHIKQVSQYSPVSDHELRFITNPKQAPNTNGVYFLFVDGKIVYIGSTKNLYARLNNHEVVRKSYCKDDGGSYKIDCVVCEMSIDSAQTVERALIRMISPEYNIKGVE